MISTLLCSEFLAHLAACPMECGHVPSAFLSKDPTALTSILLKSCNDNVCDLFSNNTIRFSSYYQLFYSGFIENCHGVILLWIKLEHDEKWRRE